MPRHRHAPVALGLLFVLMGLIVGTGGVWLIALGGSWYYLPGGLVLVLTGLLLLQHNPAALWVHAGLLLVTLAWSLWEAGLDWWPLAARGDVLFVLGLVMLTPWVSGGLESAEQRSARRGLATTLAAFAAVGLASWLQGADGSAGPLAAQAPRPADAAVQLAPPQATHAVLSFPLPAEDAAAGGRQPSREAPSAGIYLRIQDEVFVPDRHTGRPLPQRGGAASPTHAAAAPALHPSLTGADMWGLTLFDQLACRIALERLRFEGRFARPAPHSALTHAGNVGAFGWGGTAEGPRRVAYAAATGEPYAVRLQPSLLSPLGLPCQAPRTGLTTGESRAGGGMVWQRRDGIGAPAAGQPIAAADGDAAELPSVTQDRSGHPHGRGAAHGDG